MSEDAQEMRPLFLLAVEYADALRGRFGGAPTVDQLMTVLGERVLPPHAILKHPASVSFQDHPSIGPRQLAYAKPDAPRKPTRHTVYVRKALEDDPSLACVLAHELAHTTFGNVDETDADQFGARLMGLSYEQFRDAIRESGARIGIRA
jgi:hypothetical protein